MHNGNKTHQSSLREKTLTLGGKLLLLRAAALASARTLVSASRAVLSVTTQDDLSATIVPTYLFRDFVVRILYHQKITAVGRCH